MQTIKEINQLPDPLDLAEEMEQLSLKDGSQEARDLLVTHTLKAAIRFTTALTKGRLPLDEVFSIAGMALMRAVKNYKFKPEKSNVRLIVYCKPYLRGEVNKAWRLRDPINYGAVIPDKLNEPEPEEEEAVPVGQESHEPDFDSIHQHERWEFVKPHLAKLSETERRIVILQFEARLSGAEIARMLGCTRANIREARNRALKKITNGLYRDGKLLDL